MLTAVGGALAGGLGSPAAATATSHSQAPAAVALTQRVSCRRGRMPAAQDSEGRRWRCDCKQGGMCPCSQGAQRSPLMCVQHGLAYATLIGFT
jgi:hypothetical protein